MKIHSLIWVALAGGLLTWIAVQNPGGDYEPLSIDDVPEEVAVHLTGEAGPDDLVRVFDVDGMCCNGCASTLASSLGGLSQVSEAAVDVSQATVSVIVEAAYPVEGLLALLNTGKYSASARP